MRPFSSFSCAIPLLMGSFEVLNNILLCHHQAKVGDVIQILFFLSVYHMKESGWEHIDWADVLDLHYQYKNQKK